MRSPPLNLRHVEAFRAVIEAGSVSRAAERLNLSQPAVSKYVAAFERRVGFAVFERRRGRLIPTAEALLLHEEVVRLFNGIDSIAQVAEDIRHLRRGRISVGAAPAMSLGFVQGVIERFSARHETVRVSLHTRTSIQLINLTATGRIDLALVADYGEQPAVRRLAGWALDCVVLLPQDHPLADRPQVRAEDLHGERMISLSSFDGMQPRIDTVLAAAGAVPDYRIESQLTGTAAACVAAGLGIAIVDPLTAALFARDGIVARPFRPALALLATLIVPEEGTPSAPTREMIAAVTAHFGDWLGRGVTARSLP